MPGFFDGFTFWMRGWRMLVGEKSLMALAVIPLTIAVTVGGFATYTLFTNLPVWVSGFVTWIMGTTTGFWAQVLYYPMIVGSAIVFFIASVFVGYIAHAILAIPFYALLAERALGILGLKPSLPFDFKSWTRNSLRMFRASAVKTILFLIFGAVLFVLSFIPVINVLAVSGTLLILSFDLLDYSLESLNYGLRQRFAFILKRKGMWAGMACGLGLTLFIPGLTFVVAPGAVIGGAILLKEADESRTSP